MQTISSQVQKSVSYKVYKITNIVNGKCYIGITSRRMCDRWEEHVANSKGTRRRHSKFYDAIAKYGSKSFTKEIVAETSSEVEVRELEIKWIAECNSFNRGYNSNPGGTGFLEFPEHIKAKISEGQKGKIIPLSSRQKMSWAKQGDKRCARNFGDHTKKGDKNPRASSYLIRFPDGTDHVVTGIRAFCREHGIPCSTLRCRGNAKGYAILERFNGQSESSYTQAGGSGEGPIQLSLL